MLNLQINTMKNPFIKEEPDTGLLLGGSAIGLIGAGIVAWIFYLQYAAGKQAAADLAQYQHDHAADYLKPKPLKKHKSDIHELESLAHNHEQQ